MTAQNLYTDINKHGHIKIDGKLIEQIYEFQEKVDVHCVESLYLVLGGGRPVQRFEFKQHLLSEWCEKNNFDWMEDQYNREYRFRITINR